MGEEKEDPKKTVDGRSTSGHDNKKFRTRSMEKQGGMAFGFRKTATAVIEPDRLTDFHEFVENLDLITNIPQTLTLQHRTTYTDVAQ
jgi:hypothetical protein